jgi:hypothetical protein
MGPEIKNDRTGEGQQQITALFLASILSKISQDSSDMGSAHHKNDGVVMVTLLSLSYSMKPSSSEDNT